MNCSTALATAALMLASAATMAPAYADEADDLAPARVQRNWNGGGNNGGGTRAHTNNGSSGYATQAPAPVIVTRPAATQAAHDEDEDNGRRAVRSDRGWNSEQREHHEHHERSRWSREYDLDPAEAERIREAHRESDRHIMLLRDRDENDEVATYYTPRRRWWHSWW